MSDLSHRNPVGRFDGLADLYVCYRPGYPAAAIDRIIEYGSLRPDSLLIDVGSGTGISARLFAARGLRVIGIEPNEAMRARAENEPLPDGVPRPEYRAGSAEATGLADAEAAAVVSAQAFHWFNADMALREFHRILSPGGIVALLWNERDAGDPCTAAYGAVVRTGPDAAAVEAPRGHAGDPLLGHPLFRQTVREMFVSAQLLDEDGLLGRAFSASYAPREPMAAAVFEKSLRDVFANFQRDGTVTLRYETFLYLGRKAS